MRTIVTVLFVVFASFAAQAQPYGTVFGGLTILPDIDNTDGVSTTTLESSPGFNVGGSLGYKFPFGLRAEAEASWRRADADKLSSGGISIDADGDVSAATFFGNLWYDVPTGTPFTPYLGGGLGVAIISADISSFGIQIVDDDDTVLAWQFGAGLGYSISPTVTVFGDYRFVMTQDPSFVDTTNARFDSEYMAHNITAGVRVSF